MDISGDLYNEFLEALISAFTIDELTIMLRAKMGLQLRRITDPGNKIDVVVHELLDHIDRLDREEELLLSALAWNPTNKDLQHFSQNYNLSATDVDDPTLETMLMESDSHLDVALWRERLGQIETRVCLLRYKGQDAGTGFLVGNDVVMTNYHVILPLLNNQVGPADVEVVFDYKVMLVDGERTTLEGTKFGLADNDQWLIDHSSYSNADKTLTDSDLPAKDELDYGLIRLAKPVGDLPVGETKRMRGAPARGWIETDPGKMEDRTIVSPDDFVFIFQHPKGSMNRAQPLKLNFDRIKTVNANNTRLTYKANTEKGSSGSPCFDRNWNLIALHHAGLKAANQGIPFLTIRALLEQRGKLDVLGN